MYNENKVKNNLTSICNELSAKIEDMGPKIEGIMPWTDVKNLHEIKQLSEDLYKITRHF